MSHSLSTKFFFEITLKFALYFHQAKKAFLICDKLINLPLSLRLSCFPQSNFPSFDLGQLTAVNHPNEGS